MIPEREKDAALGYLTKPSDIFAAPEKEVKGGRGGALRANRLQKWREKQLVHRR